MTRVCPGCKIIFVELSCAVWTDGSSELALRPMYQYSIHSRFVCQHQRVSSPTLARLPRTPPDSVALHLSPEPLGPLICSLAVENPK